MNCCPYPSVPESMVPRGIPQSLREIQQTKQKAMNRKKFTSYYSAGRTAALANLFPHPWLLKYKLLAKFNMNCSPCQSVQISTAQRGIPQY